MKRNFRFSLKLFLMFFIVPLQFVLPWAPVSNAGDHHYGRQGHHYDKEYRHQYDEKSFSSSEHYRKDEGNEITGLFAACIFAAANITVLLSILLRIFNRSAQISKTTKEQLKKVDRIKKKFLLPLHYSLNPVALVFGIIHFALSCCRSSSLPEWGLGLMAIVAVSGLLMKYKLLPKKMRKPTYRFHTSPLTLYIVLGTLFIGHLMFD